jgi:exodeoxyribonuclease VIII
MSWGCDTEEQIKILNREQQCVMVPSMSNEDYHATSAISRSGIMLFMQSPYKFWAHYLNPHRPPKESTKAMDFGSAFHMYVLENDKFCEEYFLAFEPLKSPPKVLLKNVGRPAYEAYKAEKAKIDFMNESALQDFEDKTEGKKIISFDDQMVLQNMLVALKADPQAWQLIEKASYEQSYFWQDEESGLWLKSRPDILHSNMIVDLKTCANAASYAYQRAMVDGGYHLQGAMCREAIRVVEGREINNVINVCIEKAYPYAIGIKIIGEDALRAGHARYKEILMQMKQCFETNVWPSYEPETVELPNWY